MVKERIFISANEAGHTHTPVPSLSASITTFRSQGQRSKPVNNESPHQEISLDCFAISCFKCCMRNLSLSALIWAPITHSPSSAFLNTDPELLPRQGLKAPQERASRNVPLFPCSDITSVGRWLWTLSHAMGGYPWLVAFDLLDTEARPLFSRAS